MRITGIVAFVAIVGVGPAPLAAQQPPDGLPPQASPFGNPFAPKNKPSSPRFLFPTPPPTLSQPRNARPAQKPEVVCGLTLIPADPDVDPGIRREVPPGGPTFPIGSIDPKLCRRP
jgi:hypothetical protein